MKKILFSIIIVIISALVFSVHSYATMDNNTVNNIGNAVKDATHKAENVTEGAAKGAANMIKDGTNNLKNGMSNMANDAKEAGNNVKNGTESIGNNIKEGINNATNTNDYTASRTAANSGTNNNALMNPETWSWIIIGVVAIAIIGLFWYYATRTKKDNHHD